MSGTKSSDSIGRPSDRRKLIAVVYADMVGYSRLIGLDDAGTLDRLRTLRRNLIDPAIGEHGGRIVQTGGDSLLIVFDSIDGAVRCAMQVQQQIPIHDGDSPPDQIIRFRVGINIGDAIADGTDLHGDAVNVVARLQAECPPGGICVSRSVRDHVHGRLDLAFEEIGTLNLRNIARPVEAFVVRPEVTATFPKSIGRSLMPDPPEVISLPDRPSIAVLAFTNMSGDPEHDYFADGMVEDIITGLSRIKWLFVIARNSSFIYKGKPVDMKQVGRELGVRYVLEGSVRKAGVTVRITAQLVEADTGRHIWAERYDRAIGDIFAVQDEITVSVVAAIEPSLRQAEISRIKRKRPDNLDAYDLVLRASPFSDTGMPDGASKALPLLERALALEPDYALAHGHAAWCHENLFVRAGQREENRLGAIRHGHAAIAHGRDDAMALTLGGVAIGMVEHDRFVAQEAFEAALSLSPSSAYTYTFGGLVMGWGGEAERAVEWGERAVRLSPFDAWIFAAWHAIFLGHFLRGRFDEAVIATRKGIHCKPDFSVSFMMLAAPLAKLGRIDEAKIAAARLLALQPSFTISGHCAAVGAAPALTAALTEALRLVGLPE